MGFAALYPSYPTHAADDAAVRLMSLSSGFGSDASRALEIPVETINMGETKTHLSKYLARVEADETLVIARRTRSVARLVLLEPEAQLKPPHPAGLAAGKARVPPELFEPLADGLLDLFERRGQVPDPLDRK